jgi:hypothetical protein
MRPPIVIDEHGDISIFPSVELAARYMEPIDVRNNEYVAYDSAGVLLRLVPTEPIVSISGYLSDVQQSGQLERVLRSFLARGSGSSTPTEINSLEGLLAHCIDTFGYTE